MAYRVCNHFLCLGYFLLLGCAATVPLASRHLDNEAKGFRPPESKASVYVIRGNGIGASGLLFQVFSDGKIVGATAPGTYLLFDLEPGEHLLSVITKENQSSLTLHATAGQNYFFEIKAKWGLTEARAKMVALKEVQGKRLVNKTQRAQGMTPG